MWTVHSINNNECAPCTGLANGAKAVACYLNYQLMGIRGSLWLLALHGTLGMWVFVVMCGQVFGGWALVAMLGAWAVHGALGMWVFVGRYRHCDDGHLKGI